jgi:hypothetical protein
MSLTQQDLLDVLRTANRQGYFGSMGGGSSGSPPSGGSSGGRDLGDAGAKSSAALDKLGEVLKTGAGEMYEGFKKISDQSYTVADASKGLAAIFGEMGGTAGHAAATVIGDLGKYGQESVEKWREVSKFGASFGNDAIGFRAGAAQTRMSLDEYTNFISKNKDNLVGLGGSVTESAKAFNSFSKDFMDTDVADKMRAMGYNTEELNTVLIGNMATQRLVNLNDLDARKVAIHAAEDLATQMDAVAKITGKSRQEQEEAMKARATDAQYQAMEKLALMGLNEKEKAARAASIAQMQASAHSLGPAVEGVVKEMATGGVRSKEASEMMAALGPAGKQLQDAVNASKNAKTEEDKIRADRLMKDAEAAVIAQQNTKGYLEAQQLGIGAFKTGAESTMSYSKTMDASLKEYNDKAAKSGERLLNLANPEDAKKIKQYTDERIKNEQQSKTADGKKIEGAETTKAIVDFESSAKDAGAAINANLVAPLNEALGKSIREYAEKTDPTTGKANGNPLANVRDGRSYRERVEAPIGELTNSMLNGNEATQPTKVKDPKTGKEHDVPPSVAINRKRDEVFGGISKLGTMGVDILNVTGKFNGGTPRSKGSLGETGNLFENFGTGTLAMLHGKESVVTEDQMKSLMKGVQSSNVEGMLKNLTSSVGSPKGESGIDIGKMSKDFSTSISSVAPKMSSPSMTGLRKNVDGPSKAELEMAAMGIKPPSSDTKSESTTSTKEKTISDLDDKLDQLNKTMMQLVAISAQTAENSGKQIKATKGLGGNLFA